MSLARDTASNSVAMMLVWICWAVFAPVVAGPVPIPALLPIKHNCPAPAVRHGVGGDLKTFVAAYDRCSTQE